MNLEGRVALITGAGGGIGRATAMALAARGCHLALVDIQLRGLAETATACEKGGLRVSSHRVDVADRDAVAGLPLTVREAHGGLDILVNNAGVALAGTFEEVAEAEFDWLMATNVGGVVSMTRAFLPLLRQSDEARIVNIASVFGLIAPPGHVAYVASKFAVRGFSDALRHELAGSSVGVTTVFPGGVATAIVRDARIASGADPIAAEDGKRRFETSLVLTPPTVAEAIVRAIERRKPWLIVGRDAKIAALIERLLPVSYWTVLARHIR